MNRKSVTIILLLVFVVFVAGSVILYNNLTQQADTVPTIDGGQADSSSNELSKTKAPDITVYDEEGTAVSLSSMEGKPMVLNFWASWCPPCKSEMPHFDSAFKEYGSDVNFFMVDLVDGSRETIDIGKAYINQQGYSFPVYFDTKGEAGSSYGVRSIPTTLFIDKDGYIVTSMQGALDEATLKKRIEQILS